MERRLVECMPTELSPDLSDLDSVISRESEDGLSRGENSKKVKKGGKSSLTPHLGKAFSEPSSSTSVPRVGGKGGCKGITVKDKFKVESAYMSKVLRSMEKVMGKMFRLNQGESYTFDASDAPAHLFQGKDRKAVELNQGIFLRSYSIMPSFFASFAGTYKKHLRNKPVEDATVEHPVEMYKGHNCSCILKAPLKKFVEMTAPTLDSENLPICSNMPMLMKGMCKKLTLQTYMDLYNESNKLIHPKCSQNRMFDRTLRECFGGDVPADKLYIKLPVDKREKEVQLNRIKHPPMLAFMEKIAFTVESKPGKHFVTVYKSILEGKCTKEEYVNALPYINEGCKRELISCFQPPEDSAKLKVPMDIAVKKKLVDRPLNTVELAEISKVDFDETCYPWFFSNFLTTLNLDTIADLKYIHELGTEDTPSTVITALKDTDILDQLDAELVFIKSQFKAKKRKNRRKT